MYTKNELLILFRIEYGKNYPKTKESEQIIYYFGSISSAKKEASRKHKGHQWIKIYVDGDCGPPICKRQIYSQHNKTWLGKWECTHLHSCKTHWSHKK